MKDCPSITLKLLILILMKVCIQTRYKLTWVIGYFSFHGNTGKTAGISLMYYILKDMGFCNVKLGIISAYRTCIVSVADYNTYGRNLNEIYRKLSSLLSGLYTEFPGLKAAFSNSGLAFKIRSGRNRTTDSLIITITLIRIRNSICIDLYN